MATTYEDPRAHAIRERYLALFGGGGLPVPVEAIADDLLGLRIEESWDIDCSGMLLPAERKIILNAQERAGGQNDPPLRRFRFTIAHEIGHWVCHCLEGRAPSPAPSYCRPVDLTEAADRTLEREANVFAAELLMPESAVRGAWAELEDVDACAVRFDVSPTAMRWRLYSFGLTTSEPRDPRATTNASKGRIMTGGSAMSRTWERSPRGRGDTTIFNLDGRVIQTGAAGSRCFADLRTQRGAERALDAVERAVSADVTPGRFRDVQGLDTFDVVIEALLVGAGVPEGQIPEYARRYRQKRETDIDLRPFDY